MDLMEQLPRMNKEEVLLFMEGCHDSKSGGFAPTLHHDPHLLYTLSAIQVWGRKRVRGREERGRGEGATGPDLDIKF
jgi:hypothetical protein